MVDQQLLDYIIKYHQQGYELNTLRNNLVQQGYAVAAVEAAITVATEQGQVKKQTLPIGKTHTNMLLLISVVLIGLIGIGVFGLLFLTGEEEIAEPFIEFEEPKVEEVEPVTAPEPLPPALPPPVTPAVAPVIAPPPPSVSPLQQLRAEGPLDADKLQLSILRENRKIKNYSFVDTISTHISVLNDSSNTTTTIEHELRGGVDQRKIKANLFYDGQRSEIYIQNDTVYQEIDGTWVKEGLEDENRYFILTREIELLKTSDIGILQEEPLELIASMNKAVVGEHMAKDVVASDFFDNYEIDYEKALNIDAHYKITDYLYIAEVSYTAQLILDNTTVIPKGIVEFAGRRVMTREVTVTFLDFNNVERIIIPQEALDEAISRSEYDALVNITLPVNITVQINDTGNMTGNSTV